MFLIYTSIILLLFYKIIHKAVTKASLISFLTKLSLDMNRIIGWFGSLTDIEGVEAVLGLGVDPKSPNSVDVSNGVN